MLQTFTVGLERWEYIKLFDFFLITNSWPYYINLLLDKADYDLKNYGDWGGCYQPRSINTLEISIILQIMREPSQ